MGPEDKVEMSPTTLPLPGLATGAIPGLDDLDSAEDKNKAHAKKVKQIMFYFFVHLSFNSRMSQKSTMKSSLI